MGLVFGLVGCGDDGNSGGGGSGGGTATVSGIVYSAVLDGVSPTVAGATVQVVGGQSTTSDANGAFSLEAPLGTAMFLTTAPNAWGELFTADVPAGGEDMAEPEVIPDTLVAAIAAALEETFDPAKGIVSVEFDSQVAVGGETADLTANYGFSFVFDAAGDPAPGNTLVAGGDTVVIFANVDLSSDVMPSATGSGGGACTLAFPTTAFPSQAKVFTVVDVAPCP
ncbi:MAG: hypothetical protein WBB42_10265 [Polyangiales bacterium]|jgi:hypothetical protein